MTIKSLVLSWSRRFLCLSLETLFCDVKKGIVCKQVQNGCGYKEGGVTRAGIFCFSEMYKSNLFKAKCPHLFLLSSPHWFTHEEKFWFAAQGQTRSIKPVWKVQSQTIYERVDLASIFFFFFKSLFLPSVYCLRSEFLLYIWMLTTSHCNYK